MISIAITDDQALVRQGIASIVGLSTEFSLLWQADGGESCLEKLAETPVDVLLLDVRMPKLDGIATLKQLREKGIKTKVIMLTTFDEPELFLKAMEYGANGFLLKDIDAKALADAIIKVYQGQLLAEPVLLNQISKEGLETFLDPNIAPLTEREISILKLLAAGYSNKEIANSIFLAEGTVKNHVSNILTKLNTRDRTRAVLKALSAGII
jgi:DNA-binding NarL/FixJ family response regulator